MKHETLRRLSLTRNRRFFSSTSTASAMILSLTFAAAGFVIEFLPIVKAWKDSLDGVLVFLTIMALVAAIYLEFRRAVDYIIDTTHGGFENRFIMSSHDSFEELDTRIKRAVNIKNTFVDHRSAVAGGTSNPYAFYARKRLKTYHDFFGTGEKSWVDIVSKTTALSSSRKFSEARTDISMAARPAADSELEANTQYQTFVLRQSVPSTNFVIFEYPDEDKEVLWGWGFHGQEPSAPVFCSKDDRVVTFFWNLFGAMLLEAENIEDTSTNIFFERRWIGAWVEKGVHNDKPSWAVRTLEFDRFALLMYCFVLGENGEKIRSYETRSVHIEKDVVLFNSESQDRRPNVMSETSRMGFGRLKLDIPNDRDNFISDEFREYRGTATLMGTNTGEVQEDFEIKGRRVQLEMLKAVPKIEEGMDKSERYDLKDNPEPIYMARLLGALSKLSDSERVAWLDKAYKFNAPNCDP